MRAIEALIFIFVIPVALWLFHSGMQNWMITLILAAAILVPFHAWLEGMHWQMAPAYIAVGLLLLWLPVSHLDMAARPYFAFALCFLLSSSLFFFWVLPMFKLPKPTGEYPVGTRMLYLTDSNRAEMHAWARPGNREVVVQLWYPAATNKGTKAKYRRRSETSFKSSYQAVLATHSLQDAPLAAGRFPVIIYNPPWHGFRHRTTFMAQELASQGFVVAAVSHPYNTSMVELSDGKVAHPDFGLDLGFSLAHHIPIQERVAMADLELAIQTRDCRFLLDELERFDETNGHPLEAHLQMDRIGAYGHSFGGAVAMELAREDARVCAVLSLDGSLHGTAATHGVDKPFLLLDSPWLESWRSKEDREGADIRTVETTRMWKGVVEDKARMLTRYGGIQILVEGVYHSNFSDEIFMSPLRVLTRAGSVPPERVALIANAYSVAFFRQTLCDVEATILAEGAKPFPEATLKISQRSTPAGYTPELASPCIASEAL